MKKICTISLALLGLVAASCQKENQIEELQKESVAKIFSASILETKTAPGDGVGGTIPVVWQDRDAIDVYGYSEETGISSPYKFVLSDGAGSTSGTFALEEGQEWSEYDTYYAMYPSGVQVSGLPDTFTIPRVDTFDSQSAKEMAYDARFAYMTAVSVGDKLTFRHGACYFKIQIPVDGITEVGLVFGNNSFQKGSIVYSAEDGAITSANNGLKDLAFAEGTFKKDAFYYLCGVPKAGKNSVKSITVNYTYNGEIKSIKADTDLEPAAGVVYNLGCPPIELGTIVPSIKADDITLSNDATSGEIIYEISNPVAESAVTVKLTEGKETTISDFQLGEINETAILFTCSANDSEDLRYAYVTVSYPDAEDVEVTITQKGTSSSEEDSIHYVWDFSSAEWQEAFNLANDSALNTTIDGLTLVSTKQKFGTNYFQWGGKSNKVGETDRYAAFMAPSDGTVFVTVSSNGGSESAGRNVTVTHTGGSDSQFGGVSSNSPTILSFNVKKGQVYINVLEGDLRFYKIEFISGESDEGDEGDEDKDIINTHVYYYNNKGSEVILTNNVSSSYFTSSQSAASLSSESSEYNFTEWAIEGFSSDRGLKLNSTGYIEFTTSTEYSSTVQFWFIRRYTEQDDAKIQLIANGDEKSPVTILDTPYDTTGDSGTISLDKGVSYTIKQRTREQALLLVIVKETE